MKVVIYATNRADLMVKYSALEEYEDFYDKGKHRIIKEMDNDELMKIIQTLTSYGELVVGNASKRDHERYGTDFYIEIYNDWRE